MEAEVSHRLIIEDLLTSFLSSAVGLNLYERIEQWERLPKGHRHSLEVRSDEPVSWIAWTTDAGVIIATGRYDPDQSRRLTAHVLLIEWWIPPDIHHVSWWRADPQRPTEWTAGRTRP